jgi:hypothetical protein
LPTDREFLGLVAQDVLPVMPEMIGTRRMRLAPDDAEPTETYTMDCTALPLALINAVNEIAARLDALEERLGGRAEQ